MEIQNGFNDRIQNIWKEMRRCRKIFQMRNLFKIDLIDPSNAEFVPDGLHHNDKEHGILEQIIAEELLEI